MKVQVIIGGHVDDDDYRYASRQWVAGWYAARGLMPLVCVSDSRPWAKADAYNAAVGLTDADVVVLADGDSFVAAEALQWAIGQAAEVGWAAPFSRVNRLDADATAATLDADPATTEVPPQISLAQEVHDCLPGGGIVAMRTDLAMACGPFDPRFRGWGGEDFALGNAARTLSGNYAAQRPGPLWHLWHPPQPRTTELDEATNRLAMRYRIAKFQPEAMRHLIEEGRQPCSPSAS